VKTPQSPYSPIEGTENGPKLVLVKPESSRRCVIENYSALQRGERFVQLTLASHPGQAIVARYDSPRQFREWSYLELGVGPKSMAMEVRLEDQFIFREHDGRVFDVAFWKYEEGNHLSIVGGKKEKKTRLKGGGRSFKINNDGTISCVAAPQYILGTSNPSLVLVNSNSDLQCRFNIREVQAGSCTPLILTSHPGLAVVLHWKNPRQFHKWSYIDLAIGPDSEAINVRFDGKFIVRSDDPNPSNQKVFAIAISKQRYKEGNYLVIVSGPSFGQTRKSGGGADFDFNSDGTISPSCAKHLRLGMTYDPTINPDSITEGRKTKNTAAAPNFSPLPSSMQQSQPVRTPQSQYTPIEGTDNGPKLILVKSESKMRVVVEKHSELERGERFVPLNLSSHPGQAIVARYDSPRQFGEWSYLELGVGPSSMAMEVRLDDEFIFREHDGRVFDVAFWKYEEGNHLSIVGGNDESRTRLKGGGRSFRINSDGTISCVAAPQYVLGASIPSLVLVNSTSDLQCRFNIEEVNTRSPTPLILASHPGLAVVPHWKNPRQFHEWSYMDLGVGPESEGIKVSFDDKFIVWTGDSNPSNQKVFDISMWQYKEGNHLVIVSGPTFEKTRAKGGGRDFNFNSDGSISPTHANHLRLGMSYIPASNPPPQDGFSAKYDVPIATAVPIGINAIQMGPIAQAVHVVRNCGGCGETLCEEFRYCPTCGTDILS